MPHHLLTNFEIQKYYQNEPIFNAVCSRDNLPDKIKDEVYVINLDDTLILEPIGSLSTHQIIILLILLVLELNIFQKKFKKLLINR